MVSELLSGHDFYTKIYKGAQCRKTVGGVTVLISAHCLTILYICSTFQENISKGFRVIERIRNHDRQIDRQTDRQTDDVQDDYFRASAGFVWMGPNKTSTKTQQSFEKKIHHRPAKTEF